MSLVLHGCSPSVYTRMARLALAAKVLAALAASATLLAGPALSLADLQPVAMIAYFVEAPDGTAMRARHPKLEKWVTLLSSRPSFKVTDPR